MTGPDYAARAAAGAAFLDEKVPGWASQIDPGRLELSSECDCILGQLEGYWVMREDFGLELEDAAALGFALQPADVFGDQSAGPFGDQSEGWRQLDAAWTAEIKTRREAADVAP